MKYSQNKDTSKSFLPNESHLQKKSCGRLLELGDISQIGNVLTNADLAYRTRNGDKSAFDKVKEVVAVDSWSGLVSYLASR